MKRFIVSVLCTSVFFIGLGSLIENTSARFKSDEKALALIAQARQAIGGDANIKNVRSMTIVGNSMHTFEAEGVQRTEPGSVEINFEFPGKFNKSSRIGNPNNAEGEVKTRREFDVMVMRKEGETAELKDLSDGKRGVFAIRKGDGTENVEDIKIEGSRKFIIKKDDGTTQEINPEDKKVFIFEKKNGDDTNVVETEDGKRVAVNKALKLDGGIPRQNELFRTTFALLLSAPEGTDASYHYAGESSIDGYSCDVIEVQSAGSSFKLYLDKSSHLPRMLSYMGMPMVRVFKMEKDPLANEPKDGTRTFVRKLHDKAEMVEHQLKFSDFRNVGGLQLPHRWTQTVGGKTGETIDITAYEINPTNIAEKFREQKVFIRQSKPQQ